MSDLPFIKDGVWFIDHSSLEYIMTCARKAQYHLVYKRKPVDERIALTFGQAVHSALDALFRAGDHKAALRDAFSKIDVPTGDHRDIVKATEMLEDYVNGDYLSHDWQVVTGPLEVSFGKLSLGARFYEKVEGGHKYWYTKNSPTTGSYDVPLPQFQACDFKPDQLVWVPDAPLVELPFSLPLGTVRGIRIVWTGRIDLIVRRETGLFVVDHKTTSVFGSTYYDQFQHSSQTLGYMWAGQTFLGEPFRGFIINVFPVRKSRKPTAGEPERQRVFLVDQDNLDEWRLNTLALLDLFLGVVGDDFYPKMTNQCTTKFGRCQYFDVCALPPTARLPYLQSTAFQDVTWSPLNRETT